MLIYPALKREAQFEGETFGLVPVPLHSARRRSRGFNQAEILARILAEGDRFIYCGDLLQRIRDTGQQAKVTGAGRRARNMRDAFCCRPAGLMAPKPRLYLVDDLVTSGATVLAAAEALTRSGCEVCGVFALGFSVPNPGTAEATG